MKKDAGGKSRGFGFVRFADADLQRKVHGMKHAINGRRIELKLPRQVRLAWRKWDRPMFMFVVCQESNL